MKETKQIVVIGGGAAGLAAAIAAARVGAAVTVLEANKRVGQKILKTGNGRCNLTNMCVSSADYNVPAFVSSAIDELSPNRILEFFEGLGLMTVAEDEGRVYPLSNSANTVLDVLRAECERLDVKTLCEHKVVNLQQAAISDDSQCHFEQGTAGAQSRNLTVECSNGATFSADSVIVATGGATTLLERIGHRITPFTPVLCPLHTDTKPLKGLSGIRVQAQVSAYHEMQIFGSCEKCKEAKLGMTAAPFAQETGEVLFRDYGLSGIVIFDMSRLVKQGDILSLDLLPELACEQVEEWLANRYDSLNVAQHHATYSELMCGMLHTRLNDAVARIAGCRPSEQANRAMLPALAFAAKNFCVAITGFGDAKQAQVTRGGASTSEFNPKTLESKKLAGVFAAGETLDVDGRCGGFNLHWAWASGITAGEAAARGL